MRTAILAVFGLIAACETPVESMPEPVPPAGQITVWVSVPLPPQFRAQYFDSAMVAVQSYEESRQFPKAEWTFYPIRDSVVVIPGLPLTQYRLGYFQPRVDGWGDRTIGKVLGGPMFGDWFELDEHSPSREIEHGAEYGAAMSGTGYLSDCYYDTGGHCHRDKWIFRTGLVADDGSFEGWTLVIMVDQRFLARRDTVASGSVHGVYNYPETQMRWDVYGGCEVAGELYHGRSMPVDKWMRVQCPEASIDLTGRWH
ncbi:MAG: hypothetical protein F4087_12410 [Gemmatimonadetes bacterium]|nr:hypothetical protein [Gemmatimonadota bacterium]MYE92500.1 hypothetical protein [Gemmatimonadota bacterium]MYJ69293.1 hypothetical protein [Gemmatimonadota bacterium]